MNRKLNQKVESDDPMGLGPKFATVPDSCAAQRGPEGAAVCTETHHQPRFIRAITFLAARRSLVHTK